MSERLTVGAVRRVFADAEAQDDRPIVLVALTAEQATAHQCGTNFVSPVSIGRLDADGGGWALAIAVPLDVLERLVVRAKAAQPAAEHDARIAAETLDAEHARLKALEPVWDTENCEECSKPEPKVTP